MNQLLDTQELLIETLGAISRLEKSVSEVGKPSTSLMLVGKSLRKRLRELQEDFARLTKERGVDVCRYRIFNDSEEMKAAAVWSVLLGFQSAITVIFSALSGGPKQRAAVGADTAEQSAFNFGYTYSGSVGVVLTMSNEKRLFSESRLNETLTVLFSALSSPSLDTFRGMSRTLGPAAVRVIYKWINDHVHNWVGADIDWAPNSDSHKRVILEQKQLRQLRDVIEASAEMIEEDVTILGLYVGADVERETVHFTFKDSPDIIAKFSEGFGETQSFPQFRTMCKATLRKTTKIHLSTEKEDHQYEIFKLEPLESEPDNEAPEAKGV